MSDGNCNAVVSLVPDGEVSDYEMDDFISLARVAEMVAEKLDDKPDVHLTLERCYRFGVALAVWHGVGACVLRNRLDGEEDTVSTCLGVGVFMGVEQYFDVWQGAFFSLKIV